MGKAMLPVNQRILDEVAGCLKGCSGREDQSGRSSLSARGSTTAPDSICEPVGNALFNLRMPKRRAKRCRTTSNQWCYTHSGGIRWGRLDLPISPPFSNTTTRISLPFSCSSCFRRIAALSPAGPPPTMHTSTSSVARSTEFGSDCSFRT